MSKQEPSLVFGTVSMQNIVAFGLRLEEKVLIDDLPTQSKEKKATWSAAFN